MATKQKQVVVEEIEGEIMPGDDDEQIIIENKKTITRKPRGQKQPEPEPESFIDVEDDDTDDFSDAEEVIPKTKFEMFLDNVSANEKISVIVYRMPDGSCEGMFQTPAMVKSYCGSITLDLTLTAGEQEEYLYSQVQKRWNGGNYLFQIRAGRGFTGHSWEQTLSDLPQSQRQPQQQPIQVESNNANFDFAMFSMDIVKKHLEKALESPTPQPLPQTSHQNPPTIAEQIETFTEVFKTLKGVNKDLFGGNNAAAITPRSGSLLGDVAALVHELKDVAPLMMPMLMGGRMPGFPPGAAPGMMPPQQMMPPQASPQMPLSAQAQSNPAITANSEISENDGEGETVTTEKMWSELVRDLSSNSDVQNTVENISLLMQTDALYQISLSSILLAPLPQTLGFIAHVTGQDLSQIPHAAEWLERMKQTLFNPPQPELEPDNNPDVTTPENLESEGKENAGLPY